MKHIFTVEIQHLSTHFYVLGGWSLCRYVLDPEANEDEMQLIDDAINAKDILDTAKGISRGDINDKVCF